MGAITDSVGINDAQTSATDANEVLPTLEQPLSPTRGASYTSIDTSQRVSAASIPHNVQVEIQDTPFYSDPRENYTTHDEFDIYDTTHSNCRQSAKYYFLHSWQFDTFLPKRSTSSKSREQSVIDEEQSTVLGLDIPTTGRKIRRPAWHNNYVFSIDVNCNFAMATSVNCKVPLNYEEAILSADAEKWQAATQNGTKVL